MQIFYEGEITRFETYGFDLKQIAKEAEENGNIELAKKINEGITLVQTIYDVCGERYTSCPDEPIWKIDAKYIDEKIANKEEVPIGEEIVEEETK